MCVHVCVLVHANGHVSVNVICVLQTKKEDSEDWNNGYYCGIGIKVCEFKDVSVESGYILKQFKSDTIQRVRAHTLT